MKDPNRRKLDMSMIRPGRAEDYNPETLWPSIKARGPSDEELNELAEEGYDLIDRMNPGTPAIVQNITRFVQDQSSQLYSHVQRTVAK